MSSVITRAPKRTAFFCQAEDGMRDVAVTGVQTCALPICHSPDGPWTLSYKVMADDAAAVVEQLGLGPVDVVGHSDGGNVALLLARDHPQLVRRVVISDRKSTRLNSSHGYISYAVFCLKKK